MLSHSQLVSIAVRFLKKSGYKYIQTESALLHESPDALGLKSDKTLLIECKATRGDFLADKKKSFRLNPETGVGSNRMYLANPGIIKPEELPQKWELYEALSENTIIRVFPTDDIISFFGEWDTCRFSDRNFRAEYHFLYNCVNSEYRSHVLDNYEVGRLKIESVPNEEKWKHKEIRHRFELQGRCGFCKHRNNPCE